MIFIFSMLILIPLFLIVSFLCCQILLGLYSLSSSKTFKAIKGERKPVTILIPAHNESYIIKETLSQLMLHTLPCDRVVVVADNCDDNTAEIAERFDVQVIIRKSEQNRGKGFALDYGIRHIESDPKEIIIILDADCNVEQNAIDQMAIAADLHNSPIQSLYLMQTTEQSSFSQKIAQFAFLIKNQIRPLGLKKLNLPCQLMGTGMAFPWKLIQRADLANGNIVEDMKLGVDFILSGNKTIFIPSAKITSQFPTDILAQLTQRTRWEHGHLDTIKTHVPTLIKHAVKSKSLKCFLFALDLAIPPITLLFTLIIGITTLLLSVSIISSDYIYFKLSSVFFITLTFCILASWFISGKEIITIRDCKNIPKYILNKLKIYINFFNNKQVSWVKTKRGKAKKRNKQ